MVWSVRISSGWSTGWVIGNWLLIKSKYGKTKRKIRKVSNTNFKTSHLKEGDERKEFWRFVLILFLSQYKNLPLSCGTSIGIRSGHEKGGDSWTIFLEIYNYSISAVPLVPYRVPQTKWSNTLNETDRSGRSRTRTHMVKSTLHVTTMCIGWNIKPCNLSRVKYYLRNQDIKYHIPDLWNTDSLVPKGSTTEHGDSLGQGSTLDQSLLPINALLLSCRKRGLGLRHNTKKIIRKRGGLCEVHSRSDGRVFRIYCSGEWGVETRVTTRKRVDPWVNFDPRNV